MKSLESSPSMWYEELPEGRSWSGLWSGYTICPRCHGIRGFEGSCPVCGDPKFNMEPQLIHDDHGKVFPAHPAFMGAEGRYEDWLYLRLMEREWKRPVLDDEHFPACLPGEGPSPRASIVLLFWSYFETRIERLLRSSLSDVPKRILEDTLRRYSAIGPRLNDFYRVAFGSTYKEDLQEVGFGDIWPHLAVIQKRRNMFAHGEPQAIDDHLVHSVVAKLKVEHESWIAVYNKRAARRPGHKSLPSTV